jgi:hypothetical protein
MNKNEKYSGNANSFWIDKSEMQLQRPLITSFQAFLLTSVATLTMFLPAAVSMNSDYTSMARKHSRPTAFTAPTPRSVSPALRHDSHPGPHEKTKGGRALQTAAIVGSSAVVEAARAAVASHFN